MSDETVQQGKCDICYRPATFYHEESGWFLRFCPIHAPILNEPQSRRPKTRLVSDQELAGKEVLEKMIILRQHGWSYNQIGKRLRYSRQRVFQMLKEERENQ